MTKRMLIDASHPEETRLVVMDGNRVDDFDVEAADRLPLKGNIYLAKIVRVEPSLQAAFVEYGGNRHGFLAFGEIHPDYYQIPVADRQRILEMQAQEAEYEDDDESELDTAAERVAPSDDRDLGANGGGGNGAGRERGAEGGGRESRERRGGRGRGRDRGRARAAQAGGNGGTEDGGESPNTAGRDPFGDETPPPGGQVPDAAGRDAFDDGPPEEVQAPDAAGRDAFEGGAAGGDGSDGPGDAEGAERRAGEGPAGGSAVGDNRAAEAGAPHQVFGDAPQDPVAPDGAPEPAAEEVADPAPDDAAPRARPMSMRTERVSEGDPVAASAAGGAEDEDGAPPETLHGGESDGGEDGDAEGGEERAGAQRIPPRFLRHYKIQEVIRRRQVILVQVVKEERGTKGAALTSYISLAGRFSVLMPNSPRGGGVSRKITQVADRKRLREAVEEMDLPRGMSIIVRTAGAQRPKPEVKRDGEYLLRLWDEIRERTLASTAPALVYEEADLIKRALRDSFGRDIDDVEVEGEDAWRQARDFMRLIMPQHEKKIRLYRDPAVPLFARAGAEAQLDGMMNPRVELPSGGYIVINQTEALVAIDVNSGRATRDRHIEDTALRTNCEAADEIGRQLRLRDLAGLIVVDFIDMESSRNDAAVEKRLKDALRLDRARIQLGRISHFGLLEMSRQRLRPSVTEHSFTACQHCGGRGIVRSVESAALHVLRAIEEEGSKRRASEIVVHAAEAVALHLLNRKRERLASIEARHAMAVLVSPDPALSEAEVRIERTRAQAALPPAVLAGRAPALRMDYAPEAPTPASLPAAEPEAPAVEATRADETPEEAAEGARRKRRRRRGGRRENGRDASETDGQGSGEAGSDEDGSVEAVGIVEAGITEAGVTEVGVGTPVTARADAAVPGGGTAAANGASEDAAGAEQRDRRRGRRGGRRRAEELAARGETERPGPGVVHVGRGRPERGRSEQGRPGDRGTEAPRAPDAPRRAGPTPADPFAGTYDGVFDAMAAAEAAAEAALRGVAAPGGLSRVAAAVSLPEGVDGAPAGIPAGTATTEADASAVPDPSTDFLPAATPSPEPEPEPEPVAASPAEAAGPGDAEAPVDGPAPEAAGSGAAPATNGGGAVAAPVAEPVAGPAVRPVLLGEAPTPDAPRRRGWWSR